MDKIDCIKAVITVSKVKSLTKASEILGCNISSLSRKITHLENEFQVTIFNRTTRSIKISAQGQNIINDLETVLNTYNSIGIKDSKTNLSGELKISVPAAMGRILISKHLLKFNELHHNLKISLLLDDRIIDPVNDEVDIALRIGKLKDSSYICKKLAPRKMLLAASPSYITKNSLPKKIDDLQRHRCLGFIFTGKVRPWRFKRMSKRDRSVTPSSILKSNDAEILKNAAIDGLGLVYLLDFILEEAISQKKLVQIKLEETSTLERPLHIIYKKTKEKDPSVKEFIKFLEYFLK
jgi:DNA-binding transcriptional LysR family regulator